MISLLVSLPTSNSPFIQVIAVAVLIVIACALGVVLFVVAGALVSFTAGLLGHPIGRSRERLGWPLGTGTARSRPRIPELLRRAVLKRDNWSCVYCGSKHELRIDHIIPVSRGGATVLDNLQVTCEACNLKKSNH